MAHRRATTLGLAGAFVFVLAVSGTASAQCEATETAEVVPSDSQFGDQCGYSVAIHGDALAVGAPLDDDAGNEAGSVYMFRFDGRSWLQEQKLLAIDPDIADRFGSAVALHGNVAVAGAPADEQAATNAGSAYVFRFDGTNWGQEQELLPWNPPYSQGAFGTSVALDGNVVAIGAPMTGNGRVYVLRYVNNQWAQEDIVTASDAAFGDRFGISVAVSNDVLIVGANRDDDDGVESGSAYVFRYQGINGWVQEQKLTASDGQADAGFGWAVSMSGSAALIGANKDVAPLGSGAAYVFRYDGQGWNEEDKFSPPVGSRSDNEFGFSVALEGNTAVVGAVREDGAEASVGTAYIYYYDGTNWSQEAEVMASNGQCEADCDQFGFSVSIQGGTAVAGANNHPPGGWSYVFEGLSDGLPDTCGGSCPWDLDAGGSVGINDFLSVLSAWGTNPGGPPDFDGDGNVGITDFLALLSNWGPCL